MGTSRNAAELGAKFAAAGAAIAAANRVAVQRSALAAKQTFHGHAVGRGVPPQGFTARGTRKPLRWGVRYDVRGRANATSLVRVYGAPPVIVERGSYRKPSGWPIVAKKGNARLRRATRVAQALGALAGATSAVSVDGSQARGLLRTPFHPVRTVQHPPLPRRPWWAAAKTQVVRQTPGIAAATYRRALISKF